MESRIFYPSYILTAFKKLLPFLGMTFGIVLGTIVIALLLSILIVKGRLSKNKVAVKIASGYVGALRCTPSIVLLFIVFYGLPRLFLAFGIDLNFWPKAFFVIVALSLLYAASLSEVIRSAYLAVGKGQYEAAVSVGLTEFQAIRRIVFPQAFVVALPNLGNSLVSLLKEGSLAYTIGLIDVMGTGNLLISRNMGAYAIETYVALALIYWIATIILENLFKFLEKKFSVGRKVK